MPSKHCMLRRTMETAKTQPLVICTSDQNYQSTYVQNRILGIAILRNFRILQLKDVTKSTWKWGKYSSWWNNGIADAYISLRKFIWRHSSKKCESRKKFCTCNVTIKHRFGCLHVTKFLNIRKYVTSYSAKAVEVLVSSTQVWSTKLALSQCL